MARSVPVFWSGPALEDLRSTRDYVSRDRPEAARRLGRAIKHKVLALRDHPELGRQVPELSLTRYREIGVPPYRIVYQIGDDRIVIIRVWHGKRDMGSFDAQSDL